MLVTVWSNCYVDVPLIRSSFRYAVFLMCPGATDEIGNNLAGPQSVNKFSLI
jgi:hypothetical protein